MRYDIMSNDDSCRVKQENRRGAPGGRGNLHTNFTNRVGSTANSKYGGGCVMSVDSMSQASSARRRGGAPAKVIYNKFFKDKGFLPPLMTGNAPVTERNRNSRS